MTRRSRRRSRRITVNLLAGETTGGKYYLPLLSNISAQGIYLESPSGLERPQAHEVFVELALPGVCHLILARCRLLREDHQGFFKGRALQFVDISAIDRQHIRRFLQRSPAPQAG